MKPLLAIAMGVALYGPAMADPTRWIDNPGFCNDGSGAEELADVAYLGPKGIESHSLQCWFETDQDLTTPRTAKVRAKCDDGAKTFPTTFDIEVNDTGRVTLFAFPSVGLPEFYFSCDLWGFRGK